MNYTTTLVELHALEADYWYEVDHHAGRSAHLFYVEEGTYASGETRLRGQAEIAGFYRRREEQGDGTARHVVTNPRVDDVTPAGARFACIMLLYPDNGVPVLGSKPAVMIADIVNEYVFTAGAWKLLSRTLRPIFEGSLGATVPAA